MRLEVITRGKVVFSDQVTSVLLPAVEGEMGVLAGHADFVVMLKKGSLRIEGRGGTTVIPVAGGFAGITKDKVLVLPSPSAPPLPSPT